MEDHRQAPLELRQTSVDVEALAALIPRNVEEAIALLPEEEQRRYRECQRSVIDARRSAERIEGQMWIG